MALPGRVTSRSPQKARSTRLTPAVTGLARKDVPSCEDELEPWKVIPYGERRLLYEVVLKKPGASPMASSAPPLLTKFWIVVISAPVKANSQSGSTRMSIPSRAAGVIAPGEPVKLVR